MNKLQGFFNSIINCSKKKRRLSNDKQKILLTRNYKNLKNGVSCIFKKNSKSGLQLLHYLRKKGVSISVASFCSYKIIIIAKMYDGN
jgi:hypothetical protein